MKRTFPSFFPPVLLIFAVFLSGCSTQSPSLPRSAARAQAAPPPPPVATAPAGVPALWPADAPNVYATSAILIDAKTGRVLFQKNADLQRQVASTQKLLTALMISSRGNLDGMLTIVPSDTRVEPTKLGLRAGEQYSRRKLLQAMMVKSSNDATAALARDHSGSEEAFVAGMNLAARQLGATSSYFANPHGLPANQYSTARDIARIAFRAYRDPDLRQMMLVRNMAFRFNSGRVTNLTATNKLLDRSPAFNGMKTGFTFLAGRCLVSSANMGGREMILVQLGSKTKYIFDDAERLLYWGSRQ